MLFVVQIVQVKLATNTTEKKHKQINYLDSKTNIYEKEKNYQILLKHLKSQRN